MGKFLRVMVVCIFILAILALTFGSMLFVKREILKGRTYKLEQAAIKIARTIEATPPKAPEPLNEYPSKDVSDCTDEIIVNPITSDFWNTYKQELESLDQELINLNKRTRELMSYYRVDPVTLKCVRDPITNAKITSGKGTTQGVLDDLLKKAEEQYDLLNATRAQLTTIRIELVDTINELNSRKLTLREKLNKIVQLNAEIMRLNGVIAQLRNEIADLKDQIIGLENRITDLEAEKRVLEEENENLELKNMKLQDIVQELRGELDRIKAQIGDEITTIGTGPVMSTESLKITPGEAGTVVSVDEKHGFVVIRLTQEFVNEMVNARTDNRFPLITLIIKRGEDTFVSKVRITSMQQAQKLGIGDILRSWQQMPVQEGDTVIYQ